MNSLYVLLFKSPILSNPKTKSVFFILVAHDPVPLQLLSPDVKYPRAALHVPELFDKDESTTILTITPSERPRPNLLEIVTWD